MDLKTLLTKKKKTIVDAWVARVLETYPADSARFFKDSQSQFTNPIGYTVSQGIGDIFEGLLNGFETERFAAYLDNIIRIRAVQGFTAAQAVGFVFLLKSVVRETLGREIAEAKQYEDFLAFESSVDELALLSFNIYMQCREKIYDLKATELRDRTIWALKKANLITEVMDPVPPLPEEADSQGSKKQS